MRKPSADFFARICQAAGTHASEIAYVGDRVDNDVLPAKRAGMLAVLVRRGPWGHLQATRPGAECADVQIDDLAGLAAALAATGEAG